MPSGFIKRTATCTHWTAPPTWCPTTTMRPSGSSAMPVPTSLKPKFTREAPGPEAVARIQHPRDWPLRRKPYTAQTRPQRNQPPSIRIPDAPTNEPSSPCRCLVARSRRTRPWTHATTARTTAGIPGASRVNFGFNEVGTGIALEPDGRIVVVGHQVGGAVQWVQVAVRLMNPDGTLDPSFGGGPGRPSPGRRHPSIPVGC